MASHCTMVHVDQPNTAALTNTYAFKTTGCLDGYGYSFVTTTNTNTGINKYTNFYGCTKCPTSAPNSNPTSGPYRPGSLPKKIDEATGEFDPASGGTAIAPLNRWINTPCTP